MVINDDALVRLSPIVGMVHRKMVAEGTSYGLSEAGYDIRIKQRVEFRPRDGHISAVVDGMFVPDTRFILASTIEEFDMPTNLVGIVHDKSTWARRGLSVFNTVIEPGWRGFLTLELVYHGNGELVIPAGAGIAQVLFHELKFERAYNGKYQNQEDKPVEAKPSV